MAAALRFLLLTCALVAVAAGAQPAPPKPVPFVMQMTVGDSDSQRRAFLQIAKVLEDIGPEKVKIEVVAYEGGITSLLADNNDTATLLAALARNGVRFKACRISMRAHELKEADFHLGSGVRTCRGAGDDPAANGRLSLLAPMSAGATHPAQQDNCFTSLVKVWAQSFSPSTIVR